MSISDPVLGVLIGELLFVFVILYLLYNETRRK